MLIRSNRPSKAIQLRRCGGFAALALLLGSAHAQPSTPQVVLVQPSGHEVPANLLRISIRFAMPVEGPVLRRITLLRADGRQIEQPFLEQELWSADATVLTILMHPGRIKSGLNAREEMGPILSVGERVSLALDGVAVKHWSVGPTDELGPITSAWKLSAVRAGSRQPLVVALDRPVDGQDAGYLAVADACGRRVTGRARLAIGETLWTFIPDRPWQAGAYKLVVRGTLEDSAGNRPGSRFETSVDLPALVAAETLVPFAVAESARPVSGLR